MSDQKPNFYDLYRLVGGMDAKINALLGCVDSHDKRIDDLEKTQNKAMGAVAIISLVVGTIGGVIADLFFRKNS